MLLDNYIHYATRQTTYTMLLDKLDRDLNWTNNQLANPNLTIKNIINYIINYIINNIINHLMIISLNDNYIINHIIQFNNQLANPNSSLKCYSTPTKP